MDERYLDYRVHGLLERGRNCASLNLSFLFLICFFHVNCKNWWVRAAHLFWALGNLAAPMYDKLFLLTYPFFFFVFVGSALDAAIRRRLAAICRRLLFL